VPPFHVQPTPAWDARQCLVCSSGVSSELATPQAHVGLTGPVAMQGMSSPGSPSSTIMWDARQNLAHTSDVLPELSTLSSHADVATPVPMQGMPSLQTAFTGVHMGRTTTAHLLRWSLSQDRYFHVATTQASVAAPITTQDVSGYLRAMSCLRAPSPACAWDSRRLLADTRILHHHNNIV
jgi:hypothetical protein